MVIVTYYDRAVIHRVDHELVRADAVPQGYVGDLFRRYLVQHK